MAAKLKITTVETRQALFCLAEGTLSEEELVVWLRERILKV